MGRKRERIYWTRRGGKEVHGSVSRILGKRARCSEASDHEANFIFREKERKKERKKEIGKRVKMKGGKN